MAEVYLGARCSRTGAFGPAVAVKRLLPHLTSDAAIVRMFLNEAEITEQIDHPNVVRILDLGNVQAEPFIAMELLEGHSFAELRQTAAQGGRRVPLGITLRVLTEACRGLDAAHRAVDSKGRELQIVHRDFTPDNIHVSVTGEVKVIDFGIAKSARGAGRDRARDAEGQVLLHVAGDDRRARRGPPRRSLRRGGDALRAALRAQALHRPQHRGGAEPHLRGEAAPAHRVRPLGAAGAGAGLPHRALQGALAPLPVAPGVHRRHRGRGWRGRVATPEEVGAYVAHLSRRGGREAERAAPRQAGGPVQPGAASRAHRSPHAAGRGSRAGPRAPSRPARAPARSRPQEEPAAEGRGRDRSGAGAWRWCLPRAAPRRPPPSASPWPRPPRRAR